MLSSALASVLAFLVAVVYGPAADDPLDAALAGPLGLGEADVVRDLAEGFETYDG